jgi:signal peptidase I
MGDNKKSFDRDIGIILAVLESGNSVELPATGYSMFPTIRPGVIVVVKPLQKGEIPQTGSVIVCWDSSGLIMHRLTRIIRDETGNPLFITRGDSIMETDNPIPLQQLIGVAVGYKIGIKVNQLKPFIPGPLRYIYNRKLFWFYNFLKRLSNFMNSRN